MTGQLDEQWLDADAPCDPWVLTADVLDDPGRRDGLIGSGWLGQRIGPWGDGDYEDCSGSFLAGFRRSGRGRSPGLADLPRWAVLRHVRATPRSLRAVGSVQDWRQSLDLATATMRTSYCWDGCEQRQSLERSAWIARHEPCVALLTAEVLQHHGWAAEFIDELDVRHLGQDARHVQVGQGDIMTLEATVGPAGRRIAIASRLVVGGDGAARAATRWTGDGRLAARRLTVPLSAGQRCRVVKIVAIATDADGWDPLAIAVARAQAAAADLDRLRRDHEAAWAGQWRHRIVVPHARLQRLLNVVLYHLYAQLHPGHDHSIAPCGLSGIGWDGHIFWDADLWVHGALALLDPELASSITRYRHRLLPAARRLAAAHGQAGARWPWMSADDGDEGCVDAVFADERHLNACVAMAQWRQILAEGDDAAWHGVGGDCIIASATWFAAYARQGADGRWHLPHLCGSDEDAGWVDDNAMTAAAAAWTLRCAGRVLARRGQAAPPAWETIAAGLHIPYDADRGLVLQHAAWRDGTVIKQADATLMIWPYEHPLTAEQQASIVDYYATCYPPGVIMMGRAIDGIVHAGLGRAGRSWDCLRALLPHFRGPFLVCTESPANETAVFTTGLGGLLQLVVHGFAGVRYREDGLECRPCLPPALPWLRLEGCCWQGRSCTVAVDGEAAVICADDPGATA